MVRACQFGAAVFAILIGSAGFRPPLRMSRERDACLSQPSRILRLAARLPEFSNLGIGPRRGVPFLRSDNGAVAVIFAVALAPLALSVGVAVNYSRMTALL